MSEYQFIHFLAGDRPLDDEQLDYMRKQSSRAKITRRKFINEYHFGDFSGNAEEMLRHGFDVHLHYANFGIRRLMFRLPAGLPCGRKQFKAFLPEEGVQWHEDKKPSHRKDKPSPRPWVHGARPLPEGEGSIALSGPAARRKIAGNLPAPPGPHSARPGPRPEADRGRGGILEINPAADAGSYDEDLFDVDSLLPKIAPVRRMLMRGDLRALYLASLACTGDDEAMEPPVPAELGKLSPPLKAMAKFYEIPRGLIAAAARRSPPRPVTEVDDGIDTWLAEPGQKDLHQFLERCAQWLNQHPQSPREWSMEELGKFFSKMRAEIDGAAAMEAMTRLYAVVPPEAWPVAEPTRTLGQLRETAGIRDEG